MKQCTICEEFKVNSFFRLRKERNVLRTVCSQCENKKNAERYHRKYKGCPNHRLAAYKYSMKENYGLSEDEFNFLWNKQNGLCLICSCEFSNRFINKTEGTVPFIDHDHKNGKIRGLLCRFCNSGLGNFKDSPELLRKGADYIESGRRR